jgi:hypothetical protein
MLYAGIDREKTGVKRGRVLDFLSFLHGTFLSKEKGRGEKGRKMVAVLHTYKSLISLLKNKHQRIEMFIYGCV